MKKITIKAKAYGSSCLISVRPIEKEATNIMFVDKAIEALTQCCWFLREHTLIPKSALISSTLNEYILELKDNAPKCVLTFKKGYECEGCVCAETKKMREVDNAG